MVFLLEDEGEKQNYDSFKFKNEKFE